MNSSSVYKRDFRDPRQNENLWNYLFCRKSFDAGSVNDLQEIPINRQLKSINDSRPIETKCCEMNKNVENIKSMNSITSRCQDDKNLCRTKSMTWEKFDRPEENCNGKQTRRYDDGYKISHFPTVIDRFVPRDHIPRDRKVSTEYRDNFNRIGKIIIKYNIHDHSKCGKDGSKCEHPLMVLAQKKKFF